ncbi:MAG: histidine kinase [Promicromonosporaceae bacterium]|nr:histidine kinase [Promicromonosporaceae bacterium]
MTTVSAPTLERLAPAAALTYPGDPPPVDLGGRLARRLTHAEPGRAWLHAFARRRVGRVCLVTQAVLLLAAATAFAGGVGQADNLRRGAWVLSIGAVWSVCCGLAWHHGLLERARARCGVANRRHRLLPRGAVAVPIIAAMAALSIDRRLPSPAGPVFGLVASYPMTEAAALALHYLLVITLVAFTMAAFSPLFTTRSVGVAALALTALVASAQALAGMPPRLDLWTAAFLVSYLLALKLRLGHWHQQLWAEWETHLDLLAALAANQERLTIARDIHDTTGQSLTVIAIKADHAKALFERGNPAAIREAREVSRLARQALAETRGLVLGMRRTDLRSELALAHALLEPAAVTVRLEGSADHWPASIGEVFGWVLREATTNILRHAPSTTTVVFNFSTKNGTALMSISNDNPAGAGPSPSPDGSGLVGLRERLQAIDGTLRADQTRDGFTLLASAPLEPRNAS